MCERYAVPPPALELTHFSARLGALRLKWERHGELSSWTLIAPGAWRYTIAHLLSFVAFALALVSLTQIK